MFNIFRHKPAQPPTLFFNTDIHCHIIPGVDDGSPDLEHSLELAARMRGWGLSRIIASPHVTQDTFENTPQTLAKPFGSLRDAIAEKGLDIDLTHSAEYRMDEFFREQLDTDNIRPLPNNYLLVENSFIQEPWDLDKLLFDLNIKGYRPILAHPERYMYYHDKRGRYKELHERGTLFQVNILSLAEHYGKPEKRIAEYLIENNMVDFVGTDLHNRRHADAIDSYLGSKDYRRHARLLQDRILNDKVFN